jgi:hypothetical protein
MNDQGAAVIGSKRGWTEEDWEEYRALPWSGRRLLDVVAVLPATSRWLVPLIEQEAEYSRQRSYEKAHRKAAKKATDVRERTTATAKRPLRR